MTTKLATTCFTLATFSGVAKRVVAIRQKHYNVKEQLAFDGNDPITSSDDEPIKGYHEVKVTHEGITDYFSSEANSNKFKSNPERNEAALCMNWSKCSLTFYALPYICNIPHNEPHWRLQTNL